MTKYIIVSPKWLETCGLERFNNQEMLVTDERDMTPGETMYDVIRPDGAKWSVWSIRGVTEVVK